MSQPAPTLLPSDAREVRASVTERRVYRSGASFRTAAQYRSHIAQGFRWRIVRATDSVPGAKTDREKRARFGARTPFGVELEIIAALLTRAAQSGDPVIFQTASDEISDMLRDFLRAVGRTTTDNRAYVHAIALGRRA